MVRADTHKHILFLQSDPEKHSQSMPKDGTVHEFTSNVCGCGVKAREWVDVLVWGEGGGVGGCVGVG